MSFSLITRLSAGRGPGAVAYDILLSGAPVFLEETGDAGVYTVALREGEFRQVKGAPCLGGFDAELALGSAVCGEVIGSLSDHAAAGDSSPDFLLLRVKAKRSA